MLAAHDAGLLIGDPALQIDRSRYYTLDLAEEWIRHTGKPFVFAFWAVREAALSEAAPHTRLWRKCFNNPAITDSNPPASTRSLASGRLASVSSESDVRSYLTENIYYHLDAACLEGLQLFYRYAAEIGVSAAVPEMRFLRPPRTPAGKPSNSANS